MPTPQRKPLVYLAVILPLLVAGGIAVPAMLVGSYAAHRGIPVSAVNDAAAAWIVIPGFLLWIPASLLIGNGILHAIPPLRRIAVRHVSETGGPDFIRSQRQLLRLFLVLVVICVPAIAAGFAFGP